MALNGRDNPNCTNASNPYHQCTNACMQKSKQTKSSSHHTNKKSSGYGRSVTDGELGKKVNQVRRTYSGCAKASNPYHHCDDNCNKRLSNSSSVTGATPSTFDKKKKQESPVIDTVPPSKVGATYLSAASSSPTSHNPDNKKVDPKRVDHLPSQEKHVPDIMPVKQKDQLKDGAKPLGNPLQTNSHDVDETVKGVGIIATTSSPGGSLHSSIDDEGDTMSVISETRVSVGKYHVKESFAPILESILDKYGDIGATCHLESLVIRSYYIECVCFVVQELQSDSIMLLSDSKVKDLFAILKDVESAQLSVAWLRSMLDEIAQHIQLIDQHHVVKEAKAISDNEMKALREELDSELEALALKEQEIADIKTRIPVMRDRLSQLELKSSELDKSLLSFKSKVNNLHSKSLIDELL
ncbi:hypothetical protein RIF29_18565 [Crotalaria pallida]|uniref:Uncharacterized protein n=1 Tax=Crotalaria pallida TaxID=3830 RepID=A0AAN9FSV8_CROPI